MAGPRAVAEEPVVRVRKHLSGGPGAKAVELEPDAASVPIVDEIRQRQMSLAVRYLSAVRAR